MTSEPRKASRLEIERELIWRRCEQDPWYFIRKFVKVNVVGKGYQKLIEWDHLPGIVKWMHSKHTDEPTRSGALKARQIAWTTISNGFALWSVFFHPNHDWLQVSVGEDAAQKALFQKFKTPYLSLPMWMQKRGPQVITDTMSELMFDNGSGMISIPSTGRSGRSQAMYGCIFDEAAFMVDAEDVFAGIEPMIYGPIFMFSTANGMGNFFHMTWVESLADDSLWDMAFYPWSVRPDRDEKWYAAKKLMYRAQPHLFYQEYPATASEAFMKSGRTAFGIEFLQDTQDWVEPLYRIDLMEFNFHQHLGEEEQVERSKIPAGEHRDFELHVWAEPTIERDDDGLLKREPNYGVGVDVSEGLEHGDYSAVSVRNINTGEQVATVRAHIPIFDLGEHVERIAYWYHTALVGVERNAFGLVPLQYLQKAHYPRLYRMDPIAEMKRGNRTPRYGWVTSRTTKPKMVQDMLAVVTTETVTLHDRRWLQEATTFISTGTGRYQATPPNTDDLMMAELVVHQMELDVGRFPVVWQDDEPGPLTFGEVFAVMAYPDKSPGDASLLDRPIGQSATNPMSVEKSFEMRLRGE